MRIYLLLAAWVAMATALPSGTRDDMEVDDEPYYSELEPGLDLIAEESGGPAPVTAIAPPELLQPEKERSLMLVMPLSPSNTSTLEDLYTKKPETRIVETTTAPPPQSSTQRTKTTLVVTPTPPKRLPTPVHITLPPPVIRPDIKDLLASIGLVPATTTTTPAPQPADTFSPEIQELLAKYGVLQQSNDFNPSAGQPVLPSVDVSSYSSFKPISDRLNVDEEMKELLAQFGLVDRHTSSRQLTTPATLTEGPADEQEEIKSDMKIKQKEPQTPEVLKAIPTLHPDSMTNEMKRVLFDLGLAPHISAEEIEANETPGLNSILQERSSNNHEFVFNPTDAAPLNDSMEQKLKDILQTIKVVNVKQDEKAEFAKLQSKYRKVQGLSQNDGPDPLTSEEDYVGTDTHNDVHKRQNKDTESSSTTDSSSTTTSSTTTTSSSADAEEKETSTEGGSPSIADLESSFGGGGDEVPDESLPPPKPNGFYFLLDLNTFLNVGEDDKGVHLRLAPRLGNSKNFLPITVP
ncbi:uncharacterized protein LOC132200647 [Neocloeon triangulifer]|uniref:uncharacterized protein LOC132200647 n=1 Tax=Neocloeon triangulifer TaxID=2078957 RepID=UPI00286F2604|nr:uncharacterized protein LOC132200647 [Neocloeon triangulifer]